MSSEIVVLIGLTYVQIVVVTICMIVAYRKAGFSWPMSMLPLLLPVGTVLNSYLVYLFSSIAVGSIIGLLFYAVPFLVLAISVWPGLQSKTLAADVFK